MHTHNHIHTHQVGKPGDDDAVNEAVEQVAYADRVIINKTDLVGGVLVRGMTYDGM